MFIVSHIRIAVILLVAGVLSVSYPASAQRQSLILDTEIENILRAYAAPIFKVAGLKSSDVQIYIVNDETLNAFVAGGQKLFVNSGLILNSENANQIIGVFAHETGHIAGGHLSRVHDALSKTKATSIIAMILGGAAAVATGRGDLGAAIAIGGQGTALRSFLAYSRTQEGAADHAGLGFLEKTGQSARGLLAFMNKLGDQELLSIAQQDPYVRSHPLTRHRIETVKNFISTAQHSDSAGPEDFDVMYARMKAKLYAFINPYAHTLQVYKESDRSLPARYARAVAEFRRPRLDKALAIIDDLIADNPHDPYFHELRGQMLFENGRNSGAITSYAKAVELLPDAPLIRLDLARAQLEAHDPRLLNPAIENLEIALSKDPDSARKWRFLAIAHGRKGDMGRSYLALGEEALNLRKPDVAKFQANRAKNMFPRGSREWLQAEDILLAADELERQIKRQKDQ